MRACFYRGYGGPEVLEIGELDDPVPGPQQVLVRMSAASVSPLDCKLRAGALAAHFTPAFPKIPGRDGTGTVVACGASVTRWKRGDRVCVMAPPAGAAGTYAGLIASDEHAVVALPPGLLMRDGAAMINAGLSAWISAVETADVQPGQKVLVHAGAGAVGGLLVQLCRHLGAEVTATCRAANRDYVLSLGADRAIAYDRDDFTEVPKQDIVFDLVGGEIHARSYQVLKPGGHLVWLVAAPIVDRGAEFGMRVTRAMIKDDPRAVTAMLDLAARGVLRPQLARTLPLARAEEAHRLMEAQAISRGRLVLDL